MRIRHLMGLFLAVSVAMAAPLGFGQAEASGASRTAASTVAQATATQTGKKAASSVRAGTKINAALASTIDAKTAKPGDRVEARVLKNVKENGRVVVHKGDMLVGKVTQAQAGATAKAGSQLSVAFDHLAGASGEVPLHTVLTSIISTNSGAQTQAGLGSDPMLESMPMPAGGAMGGGGGARGGMLGGVGSGAGSAVGATAGTVGSVAGQAGSTVGRAGGTLGAASGTSAGAGSNLGIATPARAIHVQSSAHAQNQTAMNSTLSIRHGDLRLDSGTRMQFKVAAAGQGTAQHN